MLSKLLKHQTPKPTFLSQHHHRHHFTTSSNSTNTLTQQDNIIHKVNLLLPRLCLSDNVPTAIRLTTSTLSLSPPPNSLSLHILTLSLSKQPDMTHSMSLLNSLKYTPSTHCYVPRVCGFLVRDYLRDAKCKEALKVFSWMMRGSSPCKPGDGVFGVLVNGLFANGFVFEGLRVMVESGFVPGRELGGRVYRGLLRDARVVEARELDKGLCACDGEEGVKRVLELLDRMIEGWTE